MAEDALFEQIEDGLVLPLDPARGPWTPDALHGGPTAILLARAAEPLLEGLHPARATIELLRPVPVAPLRVTARALRPGRKVRLVGAEVATDDGTLVASATVLGIRVADVPAPVTPTPELPPAPDTLAPAPKGVVAVANDYTAFHNTGVEHRFARGSFLEVGPATDWIRLAVPVVAGEAPTPLQRVMAAADFGNGISRMAAFEELLFINPDLTVYLHGLPAGEWVALEAATHLEQHGVGLAQSVLWDERGMIGRSLQSLLLDAR
ncbi:MAG TPA: thioesterase family protein [Acidimicrobiales bacterium]|nr:thioesterase family protein [Acidimicrobiales bacterium]